MRILRVYGLNTNRSAMKVVRCKYFARTHGKIKVNALMSTNKIKYYNSCFNQHNAVEFEYHFACTCKGVDLCFVMSPGKIFAVLEL